MTGKVFPCQFKVTRDGHPIEGQLELIDSPLGIVLEGTYLSEAIGQRTHLISVILSEDASDSLAFVLQ